MAELVKTDFRVSVRELREESYRALRAKGYEWGQAQAASRIAAEAQVLWGNGLSAIEHECSRFLGKRRLPVSTGRAAISNRGSSFAIWGPMAASLAVSHAPSAAAIKGVRCSETLATAFWDLEEFSSWSWGDGQCQFAIDSKGDLIGKAESSNSKTSIKIAKLAESETGYKVLLSASQRKQLLRDSLTNGVEVEAESWAALKKHSWKFLVPE